MDSGLGLDSGLESGSTEDYETDVELLKRAWRQEKAAPEVLQFESALIRRIIEQIQLMEETVEEFTESGIDPLTVSLYQMDLDRTQFLLRSYYRIRLQKIEKYMFHIRDNAESLDMVSSCRCCADLQTHLEKSILLQLPSTYQSVFRQSSEKETDMVPRHQMDTFVVCKTKYYLGHIQLEDDGESDSSASQRPLDEPFEMEPNVLYFVRYKAVKKFVEEGEIDLY
ncbi:DNA replication complex GINS protein SLD5-like [Pyrus communis]|uniref:DNA replication complex GINS protein SLD5-like n=1 Tax=Pyrus communis TaxID=23211 RepID=UPI0035BFB19C